MRKISSCLVILAITLNSLQAQELPQPKIHRVGVGAIIGFNRSTPVLTYNDGQTSLSAAYNLLAGVDLYFRLTNRSSFHLQPAWTRINYDNTATSYWYNNPSFRISLAKIPLVYRYTIPTSTKVTPFVEAGIGYNLALTSTFNEQVFWICDPGPCPVGSPSINSYSSTNKSAMSTIASLGVDINLKTITIPITLRYEHYVNNYIFPNNLFNTNQQLRLNNIALMTGINF